MRNKKIFMLCLMVLLPCSFIFAVQWQMESAPFEFPFTSVNRSPSAVNKAFTFSCRQVSGKKQVVMEYSIPSGVKESMVNIYSINGKKVGSFQLPGNSSRYVWDGSAVKGAGTYTAVLKAGQNNKTIRFVIAN